MPASFVSNPNCPSNFLSGIGFQFQLNKFPGVAFFCQSANVPGMNLSVATQATRFNTIPQPGDEVSYDDLTVKFLVDENLKNYKSIHDWIRALGHPFDGTEFGSLLDGEDYDEKTYSDGVLFILDSNFNKKIKIVLKDLFPTTLSGLNFDSSYTDTEYFTADVSFKFTIYDIEHVGPSESALTYAEYVTSTTTGGTPSTGGSGSSGGATSFTSTNVSNDSGSISLFTVNTPGSTQYVADSFLISSYRTTKYLVEVEAENEFFSSELLLLHNGTNVYLTQYGTVHTDNSPVENIDADINSGNVRLLITPTVSGTTTKISRISLTA